MSSNMTFDHDDNCIDSEPMYDGKPKQRMRTARGSRSREQQGPSTYN